MTDEQVGHELRAAPENVHWGFFDRRLRPRATIRSGDTIRVETVTAQGQVDERFRDDTVERIYRRVVDRGPGPHILTGPIAIEGARPGDALRVEVISIEPRFAAGICGQVDAGLFAMQDERRWVTFFDVDFERRSATAEFRLRYPDPRPRPEEALNGTREPALRGAKIPLRPHIGNAGVAPASGRVSSRFPGRFGGNVDQWRFGIGTAMTYCVQVEGASFSCGDVHLAQGDGEVTGNGLETHANLVLRLSISDGMPSRNPLLETADAYITHGFGTTLDEACQEAASEARDFLTRFFDQVDAYTLMSLVADLGVTQVVNGTVGVHAVVPKASLP